MDGSPAQARETRVVWLAGWKMRFARALAIVRSADVAVQSSPFSSRLGWSLLSVISLLHVVATIAQSMRHGRLAMVPIYDDVAYLVDGQRRLPAFDAHGLIGLLKTMISSPPHAPLSSILASLGLAFSGGSPFGVYALSAVWVVILLALAAVLLRDLPILTRIGIMSALLAVPMLGTVIVEFRPDPFWGMFTGFVAIIVATTDLVAARRARLLLTGLLVGVAIIAKPSGLPAVLVVMSVAYLGALLIALLDHSKDGFPALLRATLMLLCGTLMAAAPYLIVGWRSTLNYILDVMINDKDIWATKGDWAFHLLYYLRFDVARLALGWLWPACIGLVVAGGVSCLLEDRSGQRRSLSRFLIVVAVLLTAYLIVSLSPVKSLMIGGLFYGTMIAVSLWSVGHIAKSASAPSILVLGTGLAIFLVFWTPARSYLDADTAGMIATDQANKALAPVVMKLIRAQAPAVPAVLIVAPGPALPDTLEFLSRLDGGSAKFEGGWTIRRWEDLVGTAQAADMVIVTQSGARGQEGDFAFPSMAFQDRLIAFLAGTPLFRIVGEYVDELGKRTIAFSRSYMGNARVKATEGFRSWEGPYPQWNLPVVQWMTADRAALRVTTVEPIDAVVTLRCRAVVPLALVVRGAGVEKRAALAEDAFSDLEVPLTLVQNETTTIEIEAQSLARPLPAGAPGPVLCVAPFGLVGKN